MARLSTNRVAWTYTADDGTDYRVAAVDDVVTQAKQGGSDGSAVALPKPANIKMRRITVRNAALGISRVVPLYAVGAPLATAGASITLNHDTDSYPFISSGNPIPEGHLRESVTHQNS